MTKTFRLVIHRPTEAAARHVSEDTVNLIGVMVNHLVKKFGLAAQGSVLEKLEVRILTSRSHKVVQGMFQMHTPKHGVLYLYVNRIRDSYMALMETVAHEMVHARQWAFRHFFHQFKQMPCGALELIQIWDHEGVTQVAVDGKTVSVEDYRNSPWEKQAFDEQAMLVREFIELL